jgi:hypothetical protein
VSRPTWIGENSALSSEAIVALRYHSCAAKSSSGIVGRRERSSRPPMRVKAK